MQNEIKLTTKKIKTAQKIGNVFFAIILILNVWIMIKPLIVNFDLRDIGVFKLLRNNETYVVLGAFVILLGVRFLVINFLAISGAKIIGDNIIIQKQFKPDKAYLFNQIVSINSIGYRNVRFFKLSIQDNNKINECLIFSTYCLPEFENKNVEQVLISLQKTDSRNKNSSIELLKNIDIINIFLEFKKRFSFRK